MLWEVKHSYVGARLIAGRLTSVSSADRSEAICPGDLSAISDGGSGDGVYSLTLKEVLSRGPLAFATPGSLGRFGCFVSGSSDTDTVFLKSKVPSGAAAGVDTEADLNWLAFGYDRLETGRTDPIFHRISSTRPDPVIIGARVSAAGAILTSKRWITASKTSTGTYELVFNRAFGAIPAVIVTPFSTGFAGANAVSITRTGAVIKTYNQANSLTDTAFNVFVVGWFVPGTGNKLRRPFQTFQPDARLLAFRFNGTSNATLESGYGSAEGTIERTGAGEYTITFTKPFAGRSFEAIACGKYNTVVTMAADHTTKTSIVVSHFDATGTATNLGDSEAISVLVLGYEKTGEY